MAKKELIICSAGLKPGHMTLETLGALKTCAAVFTTLRSAPLHAFIRGLCPKIITGGQGSPAETAAEALAALKKHSPLAFLTYGNPLVLNRPALEVCLKAEAAGVTVRVLEGISSVDSLMNFLRLSKDGGYDLRLVNIGEFDRHPRLDAGTDTLYFMAGGGDSRHAGNLKAFLKELGALYPADFPAVLANCPDEMRPEGRLLNTTVGSLSKTLREADQATTLFVGRLPGGPRGKRRAR
ncbi:MAG: hypothetical protein HY952_01855 [Elusimicrobia bacterium]|nr:hypothetical protein [Elusimicrobiota bacterium]